MIPVNDAFTGEKLAGILHAITYEAIPSDVTEKTKLFMLDTLGVTGAARHAPGIDELSNALLNWDTGGPASLLVSNAKVSPVTAAMINATAAHSLDFDDQHDPARVHTYCVILPAVLAASEAKGRVSGKTFLTAVITGVELFCRMGLTCFNSLSRGWHPTTMLGSICAAAAVAKIFELDAQQTLNAMGLAYVQTSGTTQFIADGVLAKRAGPGFAARNGLIAAKLAMHGMTGPGRYLEGEAGLFALYEQGEVQAGFLFSEWLSTWHIRDLSMKPWPCCRCNHTVIQLALELADKGVDPYQVESGVIELSRVNHGIVGRRFDSAHPNPTVHAQFNAVYNFVSALTERSVTVASFNADRVRNSNLELTGIIDCRISPDYEDAAVSPAKVTLRLKNGAVIQVQDNAMKGAPENPLSTREVLAKFRDNMRHGWDVPEARLKILENVLMSFELLDSVSLFSSLYSSIISEA
ncbi:TPA: MmgE/PrpD family protein [Klebsiella michiganensis]|nr:MmgE/PrpD family protein [Klebsiella michiganensis]